MKKRIFSRVLALFMALALLSTTAFAATYAEFQGVIDNQTSLMGTDKSGKEIPRIGYESGTVTLYENITNVDGQDKGLVIDGKNGSTENIILDLNGHEIGGVLGATTSAITVTGEGNSLTLKDSSENQTGKITSASRENYDGTTGVSVKDGASFTMESGTITSTNKGVSVENGGKFTMKDGKISNTANGGVQVKGKDSTFTMEKGQITENKGTSSTSGGVTVTDGATFNMQGGEISKNSGATGGGGVKVGKDSTFTMKGGKITENSAAAGGGISGDTGAKITLTGTKDALLEISENKATGTHGGGIHLNGSTLQMTNVTMDKNTAKMYGGAVSITANSTATITDSSMNKNTAGQHGGAVYMVNSDLTITGGEIKDNTSTNGLGGAVLTTRGKFKMENVTLY